MHTSFIETVIKDSTTRTNRPQSFKKALETLGLIISDADEEMSIYAEYSLYKDACLIEINKLRVQRNKLLHDIMKERLPQRYIDNLRDNMKRNIWLIYFRSILIRGYFKNTRGYDPKDLLIEWSNFYRKAPVISETVGSILDPSTQYPWN